MQERLNTAAAERSARALLCVLIEMLTRRPLFTLGKQTVMNWDVRQAAGCIQSDKLAATCRYPTERNHEGGSIHGRGD